MEFFIPLNELYKRGQDLMSDEGCIAADMYLIDCYAEIDRHLVSLRERAESMNEAKQSLQDLNTKIS